MNIDPDGFQLGEWQIYPRSGLMIKNGHHIHVEPKVMALLVALINAPDQLGTRDQLLNAVWPRVVVNEEVLTRAVSELRTLLGDTSRRRRYIVTIPKQGYRLLVTPRPLPDGPIVTDRRPATKADHQWFSRGLVLMCRTLHRIVIMSGYVLLTVTAVLAWSRTTGQSANRTASVLISGQPASLILLPAQTDGSTFNDLFTRGLVSAVNAGFIPGQNLECHIPQSDQTMPAGGMRNPV